MALWNVALVFFLCYIAFDVSAEALEYRNSNKGKKLCIVIESPFLIRPD